MISIGGWAVGSLPFHMMASDQNKILHFTRSVGGFLNKYGFDGVDINWCYPGSLGSPYTDRLKYIELMSALYINFWANEAMGNEKRILSATVPAGRWIIDRGFDIEALRNWVDFINIMAYDYHGSWEYSPTGIHNALNPRTKDPAQEFNAKWTVEYYIKNGFDPVNINLGIPLYGRTFHLANDFQFGVGAPSTGAGPKFGPYSRASGMLGFNEICPMLLEETGYTLIWHEEHQVPYFYNRQTGEWVSFECPISSARKALYVEERGLGGLMFFSIDSGDFDGSFCNFGIQPIVVSTIIISYYNKSMAFIEHLYNFTRHSSYDETDDLRPPCDFSDHGFTCSPDPNGIYPHPCPYQCDKWIHCSHNIPYIKDCPLGQYFINETRRCDWPWLTQCPRSFT
ncbi:chitotriosidase-1-like [Lingula anatina]|uniref:Chitotriosidase-1-like n=1 Tax=Lingula anatina TaxID=7574 RepID=A0A1S3J8S8_LINAN|nr:chitotriosidase-1-like [Lingula anatina]|eukprot:XP_013406274.1 chitotriosidase-1-like [Lingula anatina]